MYLVITGTSRGIGLTLTSLALLKGHHVLAIARNLESSEGLIKLKDQFKTLEILSLDILQKDAHLVIKEKINSWPMLDAVINNAGVYEEDSSIESFEKSFLVNSIKPLFITRALFGKLKLSPRPVSLQITSQMGSIEDNTSGGSYSYRASKAALNMLFKSLSCDEKWLISLQVHPGWVQTDMGGSGATLSKNDSAAGILKILEEATPAHSGTFINYLGKKLSW